MFEVDGVHRSTRFATAARSLLLLLVLAGSSVAAVASTLAEARQKSEQGDYAGAEAIYRKLLAEGDDPTVRTELAAVLYNQALEHGRNDDFAPTVPLLEDAIRIAPNFIDGRIALALSFDGLDRPEDAARVLAELGVMYLRAGNAESAKEALNEALARKILPEYILFYGDSQMALKDFAGALATYRKVRAVGVSEGPGLHRRMGEAYAGLGLTDNALSEFESAESLDETPATSVLLAGMYADRKDWNLVVSKIRNALGKGAELDSVIGFMLANALYLKGVEEMKGGNEKAGKESLTEAIEVAAKAIGQGDRAELHQVKGLALFMLEDMEKAARELKLAIDKASGPVNPRVHQALAAAYDKLGMPEKAKEVLASAPR